MKKNLLIISGFLAAALVNGCALTEPDQRPGEWHPLGLNPVNIAAMVVDPHDLVQGNASGEGKSDGHMAAAAIDRMHKGKLKELGDTGVSAVKANSTGGPAATGGN